MRTYRAHKAKLMGPFLLSFAVERYLALNQYFIFIIVF